MHPHVAPPVASSGIWMKWEDRTVLRAVNGAARAYRWYHRLRRHIWAWIYAHIGFTDLSPSRRHRVAQEIERMARRLRRHRRDELVEFALFFGTTVVTTVFIFAGFVLIAPFRQLVAQTLFYLGAGSSLLLLVPGFVIVVVRMIRWRRKTVVAVLSSIRCSRCFYSLVGLPAVGPEVVCPECGAASSIACLRTVRRGPKPAPPASP